MRVKVTHVSGARQGEREVFDASAITIGRARDSMLRLGVHDTRASTRHAELKLEGGRFVLVDAGSTNGTFADGRRVSRHRLRDGEVVSFGYGGPQLRFEFFHALPDERPSIEETHEFPYRSRYKRWLWIGAIGLFLLAIPLLVFKSVIFAVPAALASATLFFVGLAFARVNITVGPEGIEQESMFGTTRLKWPDVVALESGRGRTAMLSGTTCVVKGRSATIRFAPNDYVEGHLLARMVAEATNLEWT